MSSQKIQSASSTELALREDQVTFLRRHSYLHKVREFLRNISLITVNLYILTIGIFLMSFFASIFLIFYSFPEKVVFPLMLVQVVDLLFIMIFSTKDLRFSKFKLLLLVAMLLFSLLLVSYFFFSGYAQIDELEENRIIAKKAFVEKYKSSICCNNITRYKLHFFNVITFFKFKITGKR